MPQFYFPGGKPVPAEVRQQALAKIDDLFRSSPDGLAVPAVRDLVKEVSGQTSTCSCHCFNVLACLPASTKSSTSYIVANITEHTCGIGKAACPAKARVTPIVANADATKIQQSSLLC